MNNTLELKNLNLVELTTTEQEELDGGIIICIALGGLFIASVGLGYAIGSDIWG